VTVVYLDSFVLLNFLVNGLLLMCAGKLDGEPVHLGRCGLGAFLGTAYAVLSLLPQLGFLEHPACKAATPRRAVAFANPRLVMLSSGITNLLLFHFSSSSPLIRRAFDC
jgi:hypothetical protein